MFVGSTLSCDMNLGVANHILSTETQHSSIVAVYILYLYSLFVLISLLFPIVILI